MSMFLAQETLLSGVAGAVSNATIYSDSTKFRSTTGYAGMMVTIAVAGATGITITQQCSVDGTHWYDPVDPDDTAMGEVTTAAAATTKYVQFSPVLAPYIRFKIVEDNTGAITQCTLRLVYQEASV